MYWINKRGKKVVIRGLGYVRKYFRYAKNYKAHKRAIIWADQIYAGLKLKENDSTKMGTRKDS